VHVVFEYEGIRALANLILTYGRTTSTFSMRELTRNLFYYIIGAVGVGKSSAISNFRNLQTYDEWSDERRPDMACAREEVQQETKENVDTRNQHMDCRTIQNEKSGACQVQQ